MKLPENQQNFSTYKPEVWSVRKDTIYAAITALNLGLKYVRDSLADHDHNIGRTSLGHKLWAETMEAHIRKMEDALKALRSEGTERQTPDQNISITGPGPAEIKDAIVTAISKDKAIPSMDTCCDYAGWGYPDGPSVTWRTVELLRMAALLEVMSNMYTTAAENPNNPSPFPVLDRIMENDNFFDFDDLSSMISNFPPPKPEEPKKPLSDIIMEGWILENTKNNRIMHHILASIKERSELDTDPNMTGSGPSPL